MASVPLDLLKLRADMMRNLCYLLSRRKIHLVRLELMENLEFEGRAVASAARF